MLMTMILSRPEATDGDHVVSEQRSSKQIRHASLCQLNNAAEKRESSISGAHNQSSFQRVIKIHHEYVELSQLLFLQI